MNSVQSALRDKESTFQLDGRISIYSSVKVLHRSASGSAVDPWAGQSSGSLKSESCLSIPIAIRSRVKAPMRPISDSSVSDLSCTDD
jgi:hypothetical protein